MKLYKFTVLNRPDVWIVAASYSGALQLVLNTTPDSPEHIILAMSVVAETDSGSLLLDQQMKGCL